jgi:hypothetical protein
VGALLVWQVTTQSLAAFLARSAPESALKLRPNNPQAPLRLAESRLDTLEVGKSSKASPKSARQPAPPERGEGTSERLRSWSEMAKVVDPSQRKHAQEEASGPNEPADGSSLDQLRASIETALSNDPLNARALRMLGQLAEAAGDEPRATSFMQAAATNSIGESVAVYWLLQKSDEQQDYDKALYYADALLRTRSGVMPLVLPTLARLAENPQAKDAVQKLLAGNPPWRRQFFAALPHAISDARTPLGLLLAIKNASVPPAVNEITDYVNFLLEHKFFELAYYTWLQFLPPQQLTGAGLLFNGSFETDPSGLPFDWVLSPGTGATMDIVRDAEVGRRVLLIALGPGRVEFGGVTQFTLLAPGNYQFKGKHRGEIVGRRGLIWRVTCAGASGSPIGESQMVVGISQQWQDDQFSFSVPAKDCRAQRLSLELDARMASEQLVNGSLSFGELSISRVTSGRAEGEAAKR